MSSQGGCWPTRRSRKATGFTEKIKCCMRSPYLDTAGARDDTLKIASCEINNFLHNAFFADRGANKRCSHRPHCTAPCVNHRTTGTPAVQALIISASDQHITTRGYSPLLSAGVHHSHNRSRLAPEQGVVNPCHSAARSHEASAPCPVRQQRPFAHRAQS